MEGNFFNLSKKTLKNLATLENELQRWIKKNKRTDFEKAIKLFWEVDDSVFNENFFIKKKKKEFPRSFIELIEIFKKQGISSVGVAGEELLEAYEAIKSI